MYDERPSTKRIVLTLVGWGLGLLAVLALIVTVSTALAPETPSDQAPAPVASTTPTPTAVPTSTPAPAVMPTAVAPPPAPVPTSTPVATTTTPATQGSLAGKVVVIDAGHQATPDLDKEPIGPFASDERPKVEAGTTGVVTKNPESLINLQVARKLEAELARRGAKVVMVRTSEQVNIANSERAKLANDNKAALFVRLHCDGAKDASRNGISTLVPSTNPWTKGIATQSALAGKYVQDAVVKATGAKDLGVVPRGDLSGFNWSKVPVVLVEMGFMTNKDEDRKLESGDYQQTLARGIADGVQSYVSTK